MPHVEAEMEDLNCYTQKPYLFTTFLWKSENTALKKLENFVNQCGITNDFILAQGN